MRCGPTRTRCWSGPAASRSGSPASRCAAGRCWSAILRRDERFAGLMTFTLPETLWLAEQGFEDLLLAYPTADAGALGELALRSVANPAGAPIVMVDCAEHLDAIESVLGRRRRPGPGLHRRRRRLVGAGRAGQGRAEALAGPHGRAGGRAGAGDRAAPADRAGRADGLRGPDRRGRRPSRRAGGCAARRSASCSGARPPSWPSAAARSSPRSARSPSCEIVNGGGTGSLELTAAEDAVTEVTAGSGFYAPALFDHYSRFTPHPGRRLRAADRAQARRRAWRRRSAAATSPRAAATPARLPVPLAARRACELDPEEGAGEVQTPLLGAAAAELQIGDRVYLRHAKAGELCERFDSLHLVEGGEIVDEVPTYRGEGKAFL